MRPVLADAAEVARRALVELEPDGVGVHLGVTAEDETAATHRFEASLPGYRGWQWAVVVAAPPGADAATVSESALLPGPDALIAPDFIPWEQRVRPGDLGPGDLLAPPTDDPRLVPGYVATGDPVVDDVAREVGLGRVQVLSLEGRVDAAQRWYLEFGPDTEMAKAAPSTCGLCGFYVPLAGALRESFGVCANAMGADGHVVHIEYGCGAHSDVVAPSGNGSPQYEAFDDHAVEYVQVRTVVADQSSADHPAAADQVTADDQPPVDDQVTAEAEAVEATAAEQAALSEGAAPESAAEVVAAESEPTASAEAVDAATEATVAAASEPTDSESDPVVGTAAAEMGAADASGSGQGTQPAETDAPASGDVAVSHTGADATPGTEAKVEQSGGTDTAGATEATAVSASADPSIEADTTATSAAEEAPADSATAEAAEDAHVSAEAGVDVEHGSPVAR